MMCFPQNRFCIHALLNHRCLCVFGCDVKRTGRKGEKNKINKSQENNLKAVQVEMIFPLCSLPLSLTDTLNTHGLQMYLVCFGGKVILQ